MYRAIVSCDHTGGIGYKNDIPWKKTQSYKIDIKNFKVVTVDSKSQYQNIVIMGRKTWESIPDKYRPLSDRFNIIISRTLHLNNDGLTICKPTLADIKDTIPVSPREKMNIQIFSSIDTCHDWLNKHKDFKNWRKHIRWIIGGSEIYNLYFTRNWISRVSMTKLDRVYECDRYLKNFDELFYNPDKWTLEETHRANHYTIYDTYIVNEDETGYLDLLKNILDNGVDRPDRTGTGTRSIFGTQSRYKMYDSTKDGSIILPLLTTKRVWFKGIFEELMWFLRGQTNSKILEANGVNIWKQNSTREFLDSRGLTNYPEGENGPIYGKQWRKWKCEDGSKIDQLANLIEGLKENPYSRRHILSAWNVGELDKMSLPPCHVLYQFYVTDNTGVDFIINGRQRLSCSMYQRSGDFFLGVPFNIASTALLTLLIATQVNMIPYEIIHSIGDAHVYKNHTEQVKKQLLRKPVQFPRIKIINKKDNIEDYELSDIELTNYVCYPGIKASMAV